VFSGKLFCRAALAVRITDRFIDGTGKNAVDHLEVIAQHMVDPEFPCNGQNLVRGRR
jgi:hypothetical protein